MIDSVSDKRQIFFPDVDQHYKNMHESNFYSYPSWLDKYIFKSPQQKLFVILMMCHKKQKLLGKYKEMLQFMKEN